MKEVQDSNFEAEVLRSDLPVVVDFWAPWCGPCKAMEPLLAALEQEMAGRLNIVKVNVQDAPNSAMRYMVQSVPTYLFFKGGQVVRQFVGAQPRPKLQAALEQLVAG